MKNGNLFTPVKGIHRTKGGGVIRRNSPLFLEIKKVYTGKFEKEKASLLVLTNVKSHETHDFKPKAIHMFRSSVENQSVLMPSADDDASPIIYYSPAVLSDPIITFDIVIEIVGKKVLKMITDIMDKAKDVPIFAPAKSFIVIGGQVLDLVADVSEFIWNDTPHLHRDYPLDLDEIEKKGESRGALLVRNPEDDAFFSNDRFEIVYEEKGLGIYEWQLVDKANNHQEYDGKFPCMIVEIEAAANDQLKDYTAKLATAAQMENFFTKKGDSAFVIDTFEKAIHLYNDADCFKKINERKEDLAKNTNLSTEEKQKIKEEINAYTKNLQTDDFKDLV